MGAQCLKCSYVRLAEDDGPLWACPKCHGVYAKLEKLSQEGRLYEAYRSSAVTGEMRQRRPSDFGQQNGIAPSRVSDKRLFWILAISIPAMGLLLAGPKDVKPRGHCGQSEWDGSVLTVKQYLERNLRDPGSYESVEWSPVVKKDDGTFAVRHRYRARNGFGAFNVEEKVFQLDGRCEVTGL